MAISEEKLIVELKSSNVHKIIEKNNISQLFSDYENDREMVASSQLYKSFTAPDAHEFFEIIDPSDVEVFIKSDSSYKRMIANFRSTGMLVGTYSKRIFQHYAAVVVIRGKELGELLKDTEPPRHNRWDYKLIKASDKERRKLARKSIVAIEEQLLSLLKNQFEDAGEETIDAAGVGEYIPDEVDALEGSSEGEDILKAKIKIGKVKTNPTRNGSTTVVGVKSEGAEKEDGDIHNHEKNPNPLPKPPAPPKPVDPDDVDKEPKPGVSKGKGTKSLRTPNLSAQRAFPISSTQGVYKIVIVPIETYENLYVSCSALGEDGKRDVLDMESFTYDGKTIPINDGAAGPIRVEANLPATFYARFSSKEKMVLSLQLTEVIKK